MKSALYHPELPNNSGTPRKEGWNSVMQIWGNTSADFMVISCIVYVHKDNTLDCVILRHTSILAWSSNEVSVLAMSLELMVLDVLLWYFDWCEPTDAHTPDHL